MNWDQARAATSWVEDEFFPAFLALSERQHIRPLDLLAVLVAESGMRPDIRNSINAQGIFQVIPSTLRGLGWTRPIDEFRTLSATDQLPWLERYMSQFHVGRWRSAGHYHWANFFPMTMNRGDGVVASGSATGIERKAYEGNQALDRGGKGYISADDLEAFTNRPRGGNTYKGMAVRLGLDPNAPYQPRPSVIDITPSKNTALTLLVGLTLGGWAYIAWKNRRQLVPAL